jgi:hypothetical protein
MAAPPDGSANVHGRLSELRVKLRKFTDDLNVDAAAIATNQQVSVLYEFNFKKMEICKLCRNVQMESHGWVQVPAGISYFSAKYC